MSDAHRRYRAIRTSLLHLFPTAPTGHQARHFQTLVAFICGIVGSESTQLPKIAAAAPSGGVDRESFIKRMKRWSKNNNVDVRASYLPFARHIMRKCALSGVTIAFDGSAVARNCVALVASIIYQNRALPIAWVVVSGKKGHFPESMHCELLEHIHTLIPALPPVTIVGDGEFDGTTFLLKIDAYKWSYVCRTACSILITADNTTFRIGDVPAEVDTIIVIPNACMTAERYGPINALVLWNEKDHEAMYLVTTLDDADVAVATYPLHNRWACERWCG